MAALATAACGPGSVQNKNKQKNKKTLTEHGQVHGDASSEIGGKNSLDSACMCACVCVSGGKKGSVVTVLDERQRPQHWSIGLPVTVQYGRMRVAFGPSMWLLRFFTQSDLHELELKWSPASRGYSLDRAGLEHHTVPRYAHA